MGHDLSMEQSCTLFSEIAQGKMSPIHIAALLLALKTKGESYHEIAGAAAGLLIHSRQAPPQSGSLLADICGTGGDGARTINISTAAAFVVACAGLKVVKHGNRSVSSQCGSADVLEACGFDLEASSKSAERCLDKHSIAFLHAPLFHRGLRHAGQTRKQLAIPTIFNLLGPLLNPYRPTHQLIGVYDPKYLESIAKAQLLLGSTAGLVLHGSGLDEFALHGPTQAIRYDTTGLHALSLSPEDLGLEACSLSELRGGDIASNAESLRSILRGIAPTPHLHAVAANAGLLLWIAGNSDSPKEGAKRALEILASGDPLDRLETTAIFSKRTPSS